MTSPLQPSCARLEELFGPAALRLQGISARLLGWRPDHFWQATPAELIASLSLNDVPRAGLDRGELEKLMEHENGNAG